MFSKVMTKVQRWGWIPRGLLLWVNQNKDLKPGVKHSAQSHQKLFQGSQRHKHTPLREIKSGHPILESQSSQVRTQSCSAFKFPDSNRDLDTKEALAAQDSFSGLLSDFQT